MKVAILGATSQSTPALFKALRPELELEFVLAARNPERLEWIARAIELTSGWLASIDCDFGSAIIGADVILIQIRYGGLAGREFDEGFPLEFGLCGDEGLGPGGLSSAWRSWPDMDELLTLVERVNPGAEILLLTSPAGLLTRMIAATHPELRVRAICELPWTTGAGAREYFGINHLGWIYGKDAQPVPLKYWRQYFERAVVVAEHQRRTESRAAELQRLTERAMRAYRTGTRAEVNAAIELRHAPWYSEAIAPWLESRLTGEAKVEFFFSVPNAGRHAEFACDDILEVAHVCRGGETTAKPLRESPPRDLIELLRPLAAYERVAADAVLRRDPDAIEYALAVHPWSEGASTAGLARVVVTQTYGEPAVIQKGKEMKVSIIGCGRMGKERARSATLYGARVVAVFDRDRERAEALGAAHPGCVVSEELLGDAVFVCTPPSSRGPVEIEAIQRGIPFFVEKPIGVDAEGAAQIAAALNGKNLVHAVGYQNRVRSSVQHARKVLAGRTILAISAFWVGRKYMVPWWLRAKDSGGPINEQATHLIDLCRYLGGEIASVSGSVGAVDGSAEPLSASLALRFASGAFGSLFYSCEANDKQIAIRIITKDGGITLSSWDLALTVNEIDQTGISSEPEDIFERETRQFLRAVEIGDPDAVTCTMDDALKTQRMVDHILKVAR